MVDRLLGGTGPVKAARPIRPTRSGRTFSRLATSSGRTRWNCQGMADEFIELHGDRLFGDDSAIAAGLARIAGRRVVVIGFQRPGHRGEHPAQLRPAASRGLRKAMRVMDLAERYAMPVLTFVDVQGAFPRPRRRSEASPRRSRNRSV